MHVFVIIPAIVLLWRCFYLWLGRNSKLCNGVCINLKVLPISVRQDCKKVIFLKNWAGEPGVRDQWGEVIILPIPKYFNCWSTWECYFYFRWAPQLTGTRLFILLVIYSFYFIIILIYYHFNLLSFCNLMTFCLARTLLLIILVFYLM